MSCDVVIRLSALLAGIAAVVVGVGSGGGTGTTMAVLGLVLVALGGYLPSAARADVRRRQRTEHDGADLLAHHHRLAGDLHPEERAWLARQATDLPEGTVVPGMTVPPDRHVAVEDGRLVLRPGRGLSGMVRTHHRPAATTFELTDAEFAAYRSHIARATHLKTVIETGVDRPGDRRELRDIAEDLDAMSSRWERL